MACSRVRAAATSRFQFQNSGEIESKGIELGLAINRGRGLSGDLTYTLQRTNDLATRAELTNSPLQMTKLALRAPLGLHDATMGLDAQYMSSRKTLAGNSDPASVVTNLTLLAPHAFKRFDVSATIYNVFDTVYGIPGSEVHAQDVIQQDGRNFRIRTTLHF